MSTVVMTSHVWLDERGVAWLDDTNIKVLEVAVEQQAHGSSAEEMSSTGDTCRWLRFTQR